MGMLDFDYGGRVKCDGVEYWCKYRPGGGCDSIKDCQYCPFMREITPGNLSAGG